MRTLQLEFDHSVQTMLLEELETHFGIIFSSVASNYMPTLHASLMHVIREALDATTPKDAVPRMEVVAQACTTPLVNFLLALPLSAPAQSSTLSSRAPTPFVNAPESSSAPASESTSPIAAAFSMISSFRESFASRSVALLNSLRKAYLSGARGPTPASPYLAHGTRPIYEFVRLTLGVRMHGWENINMFDTGAMATSLASDKTDNGGVSMSGELGFDEREGTVGMNASVIYESIRNGKMQAIVTGLFTSSRHDDDSESETKEL